MEEKKKQAVFSEDKGSFAKAEKQTSGNRKKQKKSTEHQPRDETTTSGHNVQKLEGVGKKQTRKYYKQDTSGHNVQKSEKAEDSKERTPQSEFSKGENPFTEEKKQQASSKDDFHRKDTYHQSQKQGKHRKPEHQHRERSKSDFECDFQTKDTTFTEGEEQNFSGSKKQDKLQKKAEKAGKRVERAKKKLPKKTEYSFERVFDEKTGKAKYVLKAEKVDKPFLPEQGLKRAANVVKAESAGYAHRKVSEVEKENSAVEGSHKTEQGVEDGYRFVKRHQKSKAQRKRDKVVKLQKKQLKAETNFQYQKFLDENPQMQEKTLKKQIQKRVQKQRIKREYAKALQKSRGSKQTKEAVLQSSNFVTKVAKKVQEIAARNVSLLVTAGVFVLILVMLMTAVSSCGAMFTEGMSMTMAGSYLSESVEIDSADLILSELEMGLQREINNIETDYPDYDEYDYNLAPIGHDPFALVSYLSAVYTEFTASEVQAEIERLFEEMYELTLTPTTETRTRTETRTGTTTVQNPDGTTSTETYTYEVEVEYEVKILKVTLTATDLGILAAGNMNEGQKSLYALYQQTHGLTQHFFKPLDLYWYNYISSYYGYRINPVTGAEQFHRGMDIAVPTGTTVYAAMDGTVTTATYHDSYGNYVVIEDSEGYVTKYAHMDTLTVSAGQSVTHGDVIGTTGNTGSSSGSHLHIECLYNGEYYNPLFYFEAGTGTLYGEATGGGSGAGNVIPPDAYDDEAVQTLMEEAAKYLGYPYVWGGSNPSTSFDCSGFVCWVFSNSGVHDLPRTTAQGIYDQCSPVSPADAKAGDIIFFTGTYNSAGPVSHVGIYCGDGVMIHCGDPISYASVNSSYWQSHFYAYGRLN